MRRWLLPWNRPLEAAGFLDPFAKGLGLKIWTLVSIRGGKPEIISYLPHSPEVKDWISRRSAWPLYALPAQTIAPINGRLFSDADIEFTRALCVALPAEGRGALDAFKPPPAIVVKTERGYAALWRLIRPTAPNKAKVLVARIAHRLGGEPIGGPVENKAGAYFPYLFLFPLPGAGKTRLLHMGAELKPWCIPTDFADLPLPDPGQASGSIRAEAMDAIESEPIDWLWPQVIAAGKLTLLGGEPDAGKSLITAKIGAVVSAGGNWPASSSAAKPGNVLYLASEDASRDTIKPRLEALGADMARIFVCNDEFKLADGRAMLLELIRGLGGVRLIVFDPIGRYIDGASPSATRAAFDALILWAEREKVALLGIRHPPGNRPQKGLSLFSGSSEELRIARAAWFVTRDHADANQGRLLWAKGNVIGDRRGFAYRFDPVTLAGGISTCRLAWEPERIEKTAQQYLEEAAARSKAGGKPRPTLTGEPRKEVLRDSFAPVMPWIDADKWLKDRLAMGEAERDATALKEAAEAAGISLPRLYRAAKRIGAVQAKVSGRAQKRWELAEREPSATVHVLRPSQ